MNVRYASLGILAALIWGGAFIISADALHYIPPLFLAGLRFSASAVFVIFVPKPKVRLPMLMAAGLLLGAAQYGLLFLGMSRGVAPGIASLLIHTQIFFTIAFAFVIFDEKLNRIQLLGIFVALSGILLLAAQRGVGITPTGLALVMGAAIAGGVGNVVLKKIGSTDRIGIAVWMSLFPPIPLFIASALTEGNITAALMNINMVVAGAVLYTSVLSTIVAFAIWAMLFSKFSVSVVSAFQLLVPIFGIALSVALRGEEFTSGKATAVALVLAGLVLISTPVGAYIHSRRI